MNPSEPSRPSSETTSNAKRALEQTFARYQDELLGTLYYLVGNREDAQDAYQEAFVRCLHHRDIVPQITDLKAWVFRIAMNFGRDIPGMAWRRRRKPLPEDESILAGWESARPVAEATRREKLALLRRGLLDLRSEEQEVFLLRQNGQMAYEEIARTINIPVATVKTRMRLALRKLREAVAPAAGE